MTHLEVMKGSLARRHVVGCHGLLIFLLLIGGFVAWAPGAHGADHPRFSKKGNLLIVDQYNNRVIELDTNTQTIVWEYEVSVTKDSVTNAIVGPRDAERVGDLTLIVGGGLPTNVCSTDCSDNRVIQVNRKGKIVWQYGQKGVTGAGDNELNDPVAAMMLPGKKVLITDQGNNRVILVSRKGEITWQCTTVVSGTDTNQLSSPSCAQCLGGGHYLIADTGNNRVIEVNKKCEILWQYGDPADTNILSGPTYACRLPHGKKHTLITDSLNNRIVEITEPSSNVVSNVFTYVTADRSGSVEQPHPNRAVRLKMGNTLITDQFNQQVIEVDPTGTVVFVHGTMGVAGDADTQLNAPCDAKVVGDYTGLTSPKGSGGGFDYSSLLY